MKLGSQNREPSLCYYLAFCFLLEYRCADAAVRCLNMQHRTNGSGNICHIVRLGTLAVQDAPTHKQARNMDIVWIPCSVGSSLAAVIIVVTWFQYNLNTSAALAVITVNGAELQLFRDALDRGLSMSKA